MKVKTLFFALWAFSLFAVHAAHSKHNRCWSPRFLFANTTGETTATLSVYSWDGVEYTFRYRETGEDNWKSINSTVSSVELNDLEPGATYEWGVRKTCKKDPLQQSSFSEGENFTQPVCPAVTGLQSNVNTAENEVSFSWLETDEATVYRLYYRKADHEWKTVDHIRSTSYAIDILEFEGDVTYEWYISAYCRGGWGSYIESEPSEIKTFVVPVEYTCHAPSELNANVDVSKKSMSLSWTGADKSSVYTVAYRETEGHWKTHRFIKSEHFNIPLIDLHSNVTYQWRVKGYCAEGRGKPYASGWSETKTFTISAQYTCDAPEELEALVSTRDNELQLRWQGTILAKRYLVDYRKSGHYRWRRIDTLTHPCLRIPLERLDNNADYEWRVLTVCEDGRKGKDPWGRGRHSSPWGRGNSWHRYGKEYSGWSAVQSFNIDELRPTLTLPADFTVYSISESEIKMTWADPSDGQYSFEIRSVDEDDCVDKKVMTLNAGQYVALDSLLADSTRYYYKIRATSGDEVSEFTPLQSAFTYAQGALPDYEEYLLLRTFYDSLGGDNWTDNTDWLAGYTYNDIETWFGVEVNQGDVSEIRLRNNNLNGTIPSDIEGLSGLENITLSGEGVTGQLTTSIGDLQNLKILRIDSTQLTGPIPETFNKLTALQVLHLNDNELTDPIPSLANLKALKSLHLTGNQFTTWPEDLEQLENLEVLHFANYNLDGPIPEELWALKKLKAVNISGNNLNGEIAEEIGNLTYLETFNASDNELTGSIPETIGSNLFKLDLRNNDLSGEIPLELARITTLKELYLNDNHLSGIMDLEFSVMPNIQVMHLHNNDLRSIPDFSFGADEIGLDPGTIELKAENNELEFFYIANNLASDGSDILKTFTFYPQQRYGDPEIKGYIAGNDMKLQVKMLGNNHYQWMHSDDGGITWTEVGDDNSAYRIVGVSQSDAGQYYCVITNELVDLHTGGVDNEIESEIMEVKIDGGPRIYKEGTEEILVNRPVK